MIKPIPPYGYYEGIATDDAREYAIQYNKFCDYISYFGRNYGKMAHHRVRWLIESTYSEQSHLAPILQEVITKHFPQHLKLHNTIALLT